MMQQVVLLVLSGLQLGKLIFHSQRISKLCLFPERMWRYIEEELDFTLCTTITRSDQVLIITCLGIEHIFQALPLLYVSVSFYTSIFTWLTCFCNALWSSTYFSHLLNSSTSWRVVLLVGYSPFLLYTKIYILLLTNNLLWCHNINKYLINYYYYYH